MNVLAANPLNQQDLCTEYIEWFNKKFSISSKKKNHLHVQVVIVTLHVKIEKINDFLKDPKYSKWAAGIQVI